MKSPFNRDHAHAATVESSSMNVVLVFVLLRQQDLVFYSPQQFWNGHQDIHGNVSVFFILVIP